jgi:DNA-nicking Smr family endonuclease
MSKKDPKSEPKKGTHKEKPFFRPFEAVAREKLQEIERARKEREREAAKGGSPAGKAGGKGSPVAQPAAPRGAQAGATRPQPPSPARAGRQEEPGAQAHGGESFAEMLYGVQPLTSPVKRASELGGSMGNQAGASPAAASPGAAGAADAPPQDESARDYLRELVSGGDARFEVSDDGMRIEGRRVDVDKHVVRRLRRGELMIDARVDLHGLSAHAARGRLEETVQRARTAGERVVLVVHGKGQHSPRGVAVLRGEMAAWLSQGQASTHVAAFVTALPDDGGEGAMYVLLRK